MQQIYLTFDLQCSAKMGKDINVKNFHVEKTNLIKSNKGINIVQEKGHLLIKQSTLLLGAQKS
jgi:hypothetical protein